MPDHTIRRGNEYESCDPRGGIRIRVVGNAATLHGLYGAGKVMIATLTDGREVRLRSIDTSQLHASGTYWPGKQRRTGYRLVKEAPDG